jgi:hypothetical protein
MLETEDEAEAEHGERAHLRELRLIAAREQCLRLRQ